GWQRMGDRRCRERDAHVRGAVMVVVEGPEHAAAHPEGGLAVRDLLARPRPRPADGAQPRELRYTVTCLMNRSGGSSPHWRTNPSPADRRLLPLRAFSRSV